MLSLGLTLQGAPTSIPKHPTSVLFYLKGGAWYRCRHYVYHSSHDPARRVPRAVREFAERTGAQVVRWRLRKTLPATVADLYRSDDAKLLCGKEL